MSDRERPKRVTITQVARLANVDPAVVSKLLNNNPTLNVRPATRERVLAAVRELGYRPNSNARGLRTARARAYGLVIPDFSNPVYSSVIRGAEQAARRRNCVLLTGSVEGFAEQQELTHDAMLEGGRIDGLLLAGSLTQQATSLFDTRSAPVPCLLVNRRTPDADRYVVLDDEGAARMALSHLLELGHEAIAHLAGPPNADTAQRRLAGYRSAMRDAGIAIPDGYIAHTDYNAQSALSAVQQLIRARPRPTAILVANILTAIGAVHEVQENGLKVPGDISIVSIHDLPLASVLMPPLTTIRMPLERLGHRAIELLADRSPHEQIQEVVEGPMELVERRSTAAPQSS